MSTNHGGPAFPHPGFAPPDGGGIVAYPEFGMSLRDYAAIAAMRSIITGSSFDPISAKDVADGAYRIADAMLKARGET